MADPIFRLAAYARHRPWCPEANGPGDCTCGLYALLDSFRCTCGHKVGVHTTRDVSDVVGWPCSECKSSRCLGFALATPAPAPAPAIAPERLAKAFIAVWRSKAPNDEVLARIPRWEDLTDAMRAAALADSEAVAREYDALAARPAAPAEEAAPGTLDPRD